MRCLGCIPTGKAATIVSPLSLLTPCLSLCLSLCLLEGGAMADARRDEMLGDISKGAGAAGPGEGSGVGKRILIRGCDPVMAEKSKDMLPPSSGRGRSGPLHR